MKIYILIKDSIPDGFAILAAGKVNAEVKSGHPCVYFLFRFTPN